MECHCWELDTLGMSAIFFKGQACKPGLPVVQITSPKGRGVGEVCPLYTGPVLPRKSAGGGGGGYQLVQLGR